MYGALSYLHVSHLDVQGRELALCMYVRMYIYIYIHTHAYICIHTYACTYTYAHIRINKHTYICWRESGGHLHASHFEAHGMELALLLFQHCEPTRSTTLPPSHCRRASNLFEPVIWYIQYTVVSGHTSSSVGGLILLYPIYTYIGYSSMRTQG